MTSPTKAAHAKVGGILRAARAGQEKFLRKRGWEPLVERADVWFNPYRPGTFAHDVFTFQAAVQEETEKLLAMAYGRGPVLPVHHHAGREL